MKAVSINILIKFKIFLMLCFINLIAFGQWSDLISLRYQTQEINSTEKLNLIMNDALTKVHNKISAIEGCSEKLLIKIFLQEIKTNIMELLTYHDNYLKRFESHYIPQGKSIYQDLGFSEAPLLFLTGFAPTLYINERRLNHRLIIKFLLRGYRLYKEIYLNTDFDKNSPIEEVLQKKEEAIKHEYNLNSRKAEDGLEASLSYSDLAASFRGLEFWEDFTDQRKVGIKGAYFRCDYDHWRLDRTFSWLEYVDEGWDENYNCSYYPNEKIRKKILKQIMQLEKDQGKYFRCPQNKKVCGEVVRKYPTFTGFIVSPDCLNTDGVPNETPDGISNSIKELEQWN